MAGWAEGEAEAKLGSDDDAPARDGSPRLRGRLGSARALGALGPWLRALGRRLGSAPGLSEGVITAARAAEHPGVFVPRPCAAPLRMSL